MLDTIKSPDLRVYAVWAPILKSDAESHVRAAAGRVTDERALRYWDEKGALVQSLARVLKIGDQPAWDVYLLYDRDAEWGDEPPAPSSWMHQLQLAPERRLDGARLAGEVTALLDPARKGRQR